MFSTTRRIVTSSRAALASGVVLATLVVSLGVAVPSSSALGTSAFCKTLFTYKQPIPPPSKISTTSYQKWAKAALPFYEKLDSEAPNAKTKVILDEIVTILKFESTANTTKSLETYLFTNHKKFTNSSIALAKAIVACAG